MLFLDQTNNQNMPDLIPYIVFQGNCKEALEFYASIFDGKIRSIQSFKDSPVDVAKAHQNRIFDSEFVAQNIRFKASDDLPDYPIMPGTNISLFLSFKNEEKRILIFDNLSDGGKIQFPLDENFGMLKDKFGIQWMFAGVS